MNENKIELTRAKWYAGIIVYVIFGLIAFWLEDLEEWKFRTGCIFLGALSVIVPLPYILRD